jgi:hypothetical protein
VLVLFKQHHIQLVMSLLQVVLHKLEVLEETEEHLLEHLLVLVRLVVLVEPEVLVLLHMLPASLVTTQT